MATTGYITGSIPPEVISSEQDRGYLIPISLAQKSGNDVLLSPATEAWECFTKQQFSRRLQLFMVQYVMTTSGYYSVYV